MAEEFGNGIVFSYNLNVTGACQTGFGAVEIVPTGGVAPYTFDWYNPELGLGAYKTNLPAGTYFVRANDSGLPVNAQFYMNIIVSDCLCVNVSNVNSTTCGSVIYMPLMVVGLPVIAKILLFSNLNHFLMDYMLFQTHLVMEQPVESFMLLVLQEQHLSVICGVMDKQPVVLLV